VKSTMMTTPLTVGMILDYGSRWNGHREVLTRSTDSWRRATFAEIADRCGRLANALESLGITGDQRVGTFMWNNQEHVEAYFAVPAMGAVLHTANSRLSDEHLAFTVNAAEDRVMIVDESLAEAFATILPRLSTVHTVIVNGAVDVALFADSDVAVVCYQDLIAVHPAERTWARVAEDDAASICFTTGTTGDPKGVAYSHRSIVLQCLGTMATDALRIGVEDRILVAVPMFHATAWCYPYTGFWSGADLILLDRFLNPDTILRAVDEQRITFGNGVPTVWNDVLRKQRTEPGHDLSALERIVIGGAAASQALIDGFDALGVPIIHGYGMTETSPLVSLARVPEGMDPQAAASARLSQGRVLAGVEARVVDQTDLTPLPADGRTIGELELRGPWIAGGYLGGVGDDKFHDGWLRTGDVGTIDGLGYIRLTDRAKDIIKSGGEWISSVDLENVLSAHPAIADVTVVGVPDERWDERPCAFVVTEPGAEVDPEQLRLWLLDRVARFWIPEYWVFTDSLPRTSVGKIDKKSLRGDHAAGTVAVVRAAAALPKPAS
jgi:fatty-acyl-CoA synthase